MEEQKTDHEKNYEYVISELNKDLCITLASKIAKGGMADLVRDVLFMRMRADGEVMQTKKALKLVLETAKEIENINRLGKDEHNLN